MPSSTEAGRVWFGFAALLVVASLLLLGVDPANLDWQPALAWGEPWRNWTAVFVHFSALHLAANAAGAGLVGAFGWLARVPLVSLEAWLVAWPLTQLGLLARPDLLHYGGLSGLLHAGLACAALHLVLRDAGRRRLIGAATLALLVAKVLSEAPWGDSLRHPVGWDIAVAPLAHASGLLAGVVATLIFEAMAGWRRRASSAA